MRACNGPLFDRYKWFFQSPHIGPENCLYTCTCMCIWKRVGREGLSTREVREREEGENWKTTFLIFSLSFCLQTIKTETSFQTFVLNFRFRPKQKWRISANRSYVQFSPFQWKNFVRLCLKPFGRKRLFSLTTIWNCVHLPS